MTDIVERLRSIDISWSDAGEIAAEAADVIESLRKELTACQAHNNVLRDELLGLRGPYGFGKGSTQEAALSMPTDNTALKAALAAEREADRRKCIDIVRFELGATGQADAICLAIRALES